MPAIRITRLAVTAVMAAASLTAVTGVMAASAHASIVGRDDGYGATLQAAEQNALATLHGDYGGCQPPPFYYDASQLPNGSWHVWVEENCKVVY